MSVAAFVPIKLNNERLPGKNTLQLADGKPLISCILETLCCCQTIDDIYVFCSDSKIISLLPEKINLILRNPSLDTPDTTANDLVAAFANEISADYYVMAHATSPLLTSASVEKGLQAVCSGEYDSAFPVCRVVDFLWQNGMPFNYDLSCVPRTQELPLIYKETCGFYIYTKNLAVQHRRRIGFHPKMIEVNAIEALDINERQDFWIADAIRIYCREKGIQYAGTD